jgi:hypothetical protein
MAYDEQHFDMRHERDSYENSVRDHFSIEQLQTDLMEIKKRLETLEGAQLKFTLDKTKWTNLLVGGFAVLSAVGALGAWIIDQLSKLKAIR